MNRTLIGESCRISTRSNCKRSISSLRRGSEPSSEYQDPPFTMIPPCWTASSTRIRSSTRSSNAFMQLRNLHRTPSLPVQLVVIHALLEPEKLHSRRENVVLSVLIVTLSPLHTVAKWASRVHTTADMQPGTVILPLRMSKSR